ncbi:SIR2 family protein [Paenibacillus sp. CAU 1782]
MRILNINDSSLHDELLMYIKKRSLIPVLGSGFSRGSAAKNGVVPNGSQMINHMKNELEGVLNPSDFNIIKSFTFSSLSETYFENIEPSSIYKYLSANFTEVKLADVQKKFLNIMWPHIYTLNIDDSIENNLSDIEVILPFKSINTFYNDILEEKTHLFKLHGDAKEYIKHNHKCVLSTSSYLQSFQENRELLSRIGSDIKSNCVFYLGCSLDDELDLLYQLNIVEGGNYFPDLKNTYYITSEDIENSKIKTQKLKKFGVDTIIKVNDYNDFYNIIIRIASEASKLSSEDTSFFENPKFEREHMGYNNRDANIEYFYNSNYYFNHLESNSLIKLPYYVIDRDLFNVGKWYEENFISKNLVIIQGHRFSGKTTSLLRLAEKQSNQDIFVIPSGNSINSKFLLTLLKKRNITIFLDTGVIDSEGWSIIKKSIHILQDNNVKFVIAIDSSDEYLYQIELLLSDDAFSSKISINTLKNTLSPDETSRLNKKLSECVIPEFKTHKTKNNQHKTNKYSPTILDNVYEILNLLHQSYQMVKIENLDVTEQRLILLILLASRYRLTSTELEKYRLDNVVVDFIKQITPVAHFYKTISIEKSTEDNSGIKLICNSRSWILHNLGQFSLHKTNQELIASAYKTIVRLIMFHYQQNPRKAREEVGKFIKFDDINDIFPRINKGSLQLIQKIYNNLEDILSENYHFPHQRAKSLSWLDNIDDLVKAADYATQALRNIEITHQVSYESNFSYMHVWYTLSTIRTKIALVQNYSSSTSNISALETIYKALSYKDNLNYLTSNIRSNASKNIKDFIQNLSFKQHLGSNDKQKLSELTKIIIKTNTITKV